MNNSEPTNALRFLSIDAVQKANSGHPGMPMGMAEIATPYGKIISITTLKTLIGLIGIGLFYQMVMAQCFCIVYCT